jgi:hypothetical protein
MGIAVKEKAQLRKTPNMVTSANLNLAIRDMLLDEITNNVLVETPIVNELASRLRQEINIYSLRKREAFGKVAGVDAGSQIIPLVSRQYAVIGALVYRLPNGDRFFLSPESIVQFSNIDRNVFSSIINLRREAKLYETAKVFLEHYPDTELVLIDGPLAFSNLWKKAGKEEDRQKLINSVNRLNSYCRENEVLLAGIVKRPSARYLIHYIGLNHETGLPDASLLHKALEPGERTDVFSPQIALRMAAKNSYIMDAIDSPVYSFYTRLSHEWSVPPIRIDMPVFSLGYLDEIADYCYSTSFWKGIPLPIIRADEEVKISRRFISDVYSEILTRVGREKGEVSQLAPYWGEGEWMGV